jgi:hypothetical protein
MFIRRETEIIWAEPFIGPGDCSPEDNLIQNAKKK